MTTPSSQDLLPAELTMGTVMLRVGDMKVMSDYYQRALGLQVIAEQDGGLYLGRLGKPVVHLAPAAGLQLPGRGEAGLFHTAVLFEDQASLAATIATAAQYEPRAFVGSADHLVSEAFYLPTPKATASSCTTTSRGTSGNGTARTWSWTMWRCLRRRTSSNT